MSGPECCKNPPTLSSGGESGDVLQIASLNSYVTGNTDSKIAVVLISDVYAPKLSVSFRLLLLDFRMKKKARDMKGVMLPKKKD
ncbi:unnamed protein product [Lactuca virosa]|uniref:Uncharacterized protein n=1 Tax=Lactuca virosa TaxID=75947 RepID=A0AAU9NZM8_9ASTR|nr:unnamed protein product [Lactuca virosa]